MSMNLSNSRVIILLRFFSIRVEKKQGREVFFIRLMSNQGRLLFKGATSDKALLGG